MKNTEDFTKFLETSHNAVDELAEILERNQVSDLRCHSRLAIIPAFLAIGKLY